MTASNMFLFWGSGSIPCWKPMLVLEEKNLQGYGQKMLSFSKKEHKGDDVMKLNPRGQLPTFRDGDLVINESGAICEYLEFKYPDQGTNLLPKDATQRAKVLQRVAESQNLHKTMMEGVVYYMWFTKEEDRKPDQVVKKKQDLKDELERWEKYMESQGDGTFVVGNSFTMADVFVFPYLAFADRLKLDFTKYPALNAYYQRVKERPSVQATWPPHWKEEAGKGLFDEL